MTVADPMFGFLAAEEERFHRNRVVVKLGNNTIESWVGRDITKYVPGLYWITYLSYDLLRAHNLPVKPIKAIAKETTESHAGLVVRLYDEPVQWKHTKKIDDVCFSTNGIFSIDRVKPLISLANNYVELSDLLNDWR
jgi:hypothetical protein